jgi:hypothetical protein
MKYGTACFQSGAIVWASTLEALTERIDHLTRLGFEPHEQQPRLPQGMYWYARLVAPKGMDARKIPPSLL